MTNAALIAKQFGLTECGNGFVNSRPSWRLGSRERCSSQPRTQGAAPLCQIGDDFGPNGPSSPGSFAALVPPE